MDGGGREGPTWRERGNTTAGDKGPSTPRKDHGKFRQLGIKEHLAFSRQRPDVVGRERLEGGGGGPQGHGNLSSASSHARYCGHTLYCMIHEAWWPPGKSGRERGAGPWD